MGYVKFDRTKHYTLIELLTQIRETEKSFIIEKKTVKQGKIEILLNLKPTTVSKEYKIKIIAKRNSKNVNVFVVAPRVTQYEDGKKVPHLYSNDSLCLFYPKYNEWKYTDLWSETLIPWTSLWLYYYEVWQETGEWLGGGVHGDKVIAF